MKEKPTIFPAIIVEGKYDKIKLESLFDALILPTDGFRIFKDKKMRTLIKALGEKQGLVLLTDSDAAGFLIRRHLAGIVPPEQITHLYIPDLPGKERRKAHPSKEGKLGVEGIPAEVLVGLFREAGLLGEPKKRGREGITSMDLYDVGLSGGKNSNALRQALIKTLGLPARISAKALPPVLSRLLTREDFLRIIKEQRENADSTKPAQF